MTKKNQTHDNETQSNQTEGDLPAVQEDNLPAQRNGGGDQSRTLDVVGREIPILEVDQEQGLFRNSLSGVQFETFKGIILGSRPSRARFDDNGFQAGAKPLCRSADAIVAEDGTLCEECEFAKAWDHGRPVCPTTVNLLILNLDENLLPMLFRGRGAHFKPIVKHLSWAEYCHHKMPQLVSNFSLKPKTRGSVNFYALDISVERIIESKEELEKYLKLAKRYGSQFDQADDNGNGEDGEEDIPF